MGIDFLRNIAKRTILRLPKRRLASNSGFWNESLCLSYQQQCRDYIRFHCQSGKTRVSEISRPAYSSYLYSSYSSLSSPSNPRMGFLSWYLGMLESRPVLTKSVSACLIYAAADLTSQMITMPPSGSFDSIRTLRMAGYGLLILGPAQHLWFNFMARVLPKRDVVTTLKKLFGGQLIYGPTVTGIFFSFNAILQGESGLEIAARLKRDLLPTLISGLMYWPICDFFTYKIIPVHLQPLMNSSFSYVWTIYLTYMASLTKAAAD
ncbi:unnamed protein product [Ilex paraguariensis]|uniref:PXMP2/4 family protein 4 n=1 Tax=Ilex paraguariensis TaxID=185542 RepID=A0ABC8UPB1_9AQUA